MKKNENEMKQKNEEILKIWRRLGLLKGLKEGSINEWRCARSFQNLAEYFISSNAPEMEALATITFPFVRRVLCCCNPRLHRILTAEEVVDFFNTTTARECWDYYKKWIDKQNFKSQSVKGERCRVCYRLLDNFIKDGHEEDSLTEFWNNIFVIGAEIKPTAALFKRFTAQTYDFEAELVSWACDVFVDKNNGKK